MASRDPRASRERPALRVRLDRQALRDSRGVTVRTGPPRTSPVCQRQLDLLAIQETCQFDFVSNRMWEVTWGYGFEDRNGGAPKFTKDSNGGLTQINDRPTSWTDPHLYPTGPVANKVTKYTFADGTVRTATVTRKANACPLIVWDTVAPAA